MFASGAPGHPRAITMWDFSWLERRWAGAGYEDWDRVLEELVERGYDSVRIDAYPHLVAGGANTTWTLTPRWNQQAWGAQSRIDVAVFPSLPEFIRAARRAGIGVALSTWFREDTTDARMAPRRPADLGALWVTTLCALDDADVLDALVYVDLCNEFPMPPGAPYLYGHDNGEPLPVAGETVQQWMADAIGAVRAEYPELRYGFSF
ncbi:cellulase-like family protein, partial [Microbacterium insulae]